MLTVGNRVGAKLQGDVMPALDVRKKFYGSLTIVEKR